MRHLLSERDKSEATDQTFPHTNPPTVLSSFPLDNTRSLLCTRRTSTSRPFRHCVTCGRKRLGIDLRRVRGQGCEHGRFAPSCVARVRLLAPVLVKHFPHGLTRTLPSSADARPLSRRIVVCPTSCPSSRRVSASPRGRQRGDAGLIASAGRSAAAAATTGSIAGRDGRRGKVAPAAQAPPPTVLSRYFLLHVSVCDVDPTLIGALSR